MRNIQMIVMLGLGCVLAAACDAVEHDGVVQQGQVTDVRAIEVEIRGLDELGEDQEAGPLFTEDISAEPPGVEGPAGQCCFVHCGGTGYYENLWWVQHNCNGVGWDWCAGNYGTKLINAEWWSC